MLGMECVWISTAGYSSISSKTSRGDTASSIILLPPQEDLPDSSFPRLCQTLPIFGKNIYLAILLLGNARKAYFCLYTCVVVGQMSMQQCNIIG